MKYLSVCSGIEAATVAWHPLSWEPIGFSEIEKFPSNVLAHHYPGVPNYGDMTQHERWPTTDIDVLVGGTPCQSFSVAGLRQGMADPRGNLALVYLAIAEQYRPNWLVWENVPGVLSSDGGRDFGSIIGGMVELGYSPSWRVLDAQYFGVPQRRRRVFIVASARDWRDSAKVLFEPESLRRHPAPCREAGQSVAPSLAARTKGGGGLGTDTELDGGLIPDTAFAINTKQGKMQPPDFEVYLPQVVGALSDGAHCGGGLNGQDAYTGRIIPDIKGADLYNGLDTDEISAAVCTDSSHNRNTVYAIHGTQDPCVSGQAFALGRNTGQENAVAYGIDEEQNTTKDFFGTLKARENGGGFEGAVAFAQNQRDEVRLMDRAGALAAEPGAKQQTYVFKQGAGEIGRAHV